jgi:hypothetical protein
MSKKYRRDIARPAAAARPAVTSASDSSTQTAPAARQSTRNLSTAIPVPTAEAFRRDLAWIGLTTLVVVILMIVAYYVVPH